MNYQMKYLITITKSVLTACILVISFSLYGNSIFDESTPSTFVNDYADLLIEFQEQQLEIKLQEFNKKSSNQIAIVTVKSLEGYSAAQFSYKLAEQWGVGQKDKNNGILIVVKPKYQNEKGEVYISVGYGLEHLVPDAIAKRIVDKTLIPRFKSEKFYHGLMNAVDQIIDITSGEDTYKEKIVLYNGEIRFAIIVFAIITMCIPVFYLRYLKNRRIAIEYAHFYVQGEYNAENIFQQVDLMEKKFNIKYKKFKRQILKYEWTSKNNLIKYSDKVDRHLFCYLLNGRSRKFMFWKMADPFMISIGIYLLILLLICSCFVFIKTNLIGFFISLIVSYVVLNAMFSVLITFLEMYQHILRKRGFYVGGVSVALFSLNAFFKGNIKKRYNANTNSYSYYPHVIISSSSSFGGGVSGSFCGGGGFGGGSFGGGGAGGSW